MKHIPVRFKSPRQKTEWDDPRLSTIVRTAAIYCAWLIFKKTEKRSTITDILRLDDEQREVCRKTGQEYYLSTHQLWRGLDESSPFISVKDGQEIADQVNLAFPYSGTPGKKTCLFHNVGLGPHFHLQGGADEPNYQDAIQEEVL